MLRLSLDGTWREIAHSPTRLLNFARVSPDRRSIAVTGRTTTIGWIYIPVKR